MLSKRLDELRLDEIHDTRNDRGKRWRLGTLLRATLGAMVAGTKSLAQVEELSERVGRPTQRLLGIRRRLSDTTLRNALCSIEPDQMRKPLHALTRKAHRRKALEPNDLPFGVVSLDGLGLKPARVRRSSSPSCAASLTPCSRCSAPSLSAPTSAAPHRGKLMTDLFVALISTTQLELQDPKPLRLR